MLKNLISIIYFILLVTFSSSLIADDSEFKLWIIDFKKKAINYGISKNVVEEVISEARFLPNVIK